MLAEGRFKSAQKLLVPVHRFMETEWHACPDPVLAPTPCGGRVKLLSMDQLGVLAYLVAGIVHRPSGMCDFCFGLYSHIYALSLSVS